MDSTSLWCGPTRDNALVLALLKGSKLKLLMGRKAGVLVVRKLKILIIFVVISLTNIQFGHAIVAIPPPPTPSLPSLQTIKHPNVPRISVL